MYISNSLEGPPLIPPLYIYIEFFGKFTLHFLPLSLNTIGKVKFQYNQTTFKMNLLYNIFDTLHD
jgi:hypothetical protein